MQAEGEPSKVPAQVTRSLFAALASNAAGSKSEQGTKLAFQDAETKKDQREQTTINVEEK